MPISDSDKFIYETAASRVTDLNRVIFNYRLVYVSLLAAYFTSLSFISGISESAGFFTAPEAYSILLLLVTVAAFVGVTTMLFFDFIHQELLENSITSMEAIEATNKDFEGRRVLARPSSAITSLYINTAIFLFYAVPGSFLYVFSGYIAQSVHATREPGYFMIYRDAFCEFEYEQDFSTGLIVGKLYDPFCEQTLKAFQFNEDFIAIVFIVFYVSTFFAALSLIVSAHRIFGRFINCVMKKRLTWATVNIDELPRQPAPKRFFDIFMNCVLIVYIFFSISYFVAMVLFDQLLVYTQTTYF